MIRVVVIATPPFALPSLDALQRAPDATVAAVVTNPDRPRGRGLALAPSPVKEWAAAHGVPVHYTEELARDQTRGQASLANYLPLDAAVVIASSLFIPRWLREPDPTFARWGAINLHPSLLPALRGPAPINWALINGDRETGVSTILLTKELDAGDVLLQERIAIGEREDAGTLSARLAARGAEIVLATLRGLRAGTLTPVPQRGVPTYAPKITAETQRVKWDAPAAAVDRLIRGLYPDTPATTLFGGQLIQLLEAEPVVRGETTPGEVVAVSARGLTVSCGRDALLVKAVKPAGRAAMSAAAFAAGRRVAPGARFA